MLGALLLAVVGLVVVVLNINTIALSQINKALNRYLVAGGKLEAVDIHPLEARVTLSGLHINPPPGFESHPFLALQVLEVDIAPWDLFKGSVVVKELSIKGVSLNVVRDKNGRLSPLELVVVKAPGKAALPEKEQQDTEPPWIPPIHVNTIHAEDLSFRLVDRLSKQDWSAGLGADLSIQGLRLEDLLKLDILVDRFNLKLNNILVEQPSGFSSEPLLAMNQCELISQGIDLKSSRLSISDIILDKLSASLERNADREINLIKLFQTWLPVEEYDNDDASDPAVLATVVDLAVPAFELPTLVVDNLQLMSITAQVLDTMEGQGQPWRAGFDGLDIQATGVEVGDLTEQAIALASLDLDLKGIAIDQPPGFSGNPLLAIGNIQMASSGIDLSTSRVSVSDVKLDTLSASLERNPDREINLVKLMEAWLPTGKDDNDDASGGAAGSTTVVDLPDLTFELPTLVVDNLQLMSITAQVLDTMEGQGQPWRAGFDGLDIQATGVEVGDLAEQAVALASLDLNLKGMAVDQPPGFSETPLLSMGSFKLTSQGIDLGASRASISDVILDQLSISVERNADHDVNLLKLKETWLPAAAETVHEKQDSSESITNASSSGFELPTLEVDTIELKSASAQLLASIEDQLWRAGFGGLDIRVTGVEAGNPTEQAVSLASFDLDLKGLTVDQLPGFGTENLFSLEKFTIISEKPDKTNKELVIKQVSLTGLTSSVAMHADGVTNLQVLNKALFSKSEASREEPAADRKAPSPAPDLQPVLFEQISLDGGPVTYRDEYFAEETLVASLDNIHLEATDLRLFNKEEGVDPASAAMSFELAQPGELPTAYFGSLVDVGPIGYGVPMVNSQVRLVGLKLDTLGSLVPKATRTALGASGLDGALALALDAEAINLNAAVLTDHGIKYKGLKVKGSLEAPVVEPGPIMAGALGRISEGLVNLGKGGLKSGVNIAEGGVEAAVELGSGAVEVGINLGKSLFSATAGLVTMDKGKVKEGASGTTKGTVDITKGSVKGSGQAAGDSLKSSGSNLKGQDRVEAWEQGIPDRYQTYMQHAKTVLAEMPYPPVTK